MSLCNIWYNKKENKSASKEPKHNKLMAALEAVHAHVASLRKALNKTNITQMQS